MIKRILPFVLAFAVLLSFMVSPLRVKADTSSVGFDVLDFCTANGSFSNRVTVNNTATVTFDISDFFGKLKGFDFEILLSWTDLKPTSFSLSDGTQSYPVTVSDATSSIIRLSGDLRGYSFGTLFLTITAPGSSYIQFNRFWIDLVSSNRANLGTTLKALGGTSSTMSPGGQASVTTSSSVTTSVFTFSLPYSVWSNYDYIDFSGAIVNGEISAITADISDNVFIPIYTSVFQDMSSRSVYYFSCRLDLTQGDLGSSGDLDIWFNSDVVASSCQFSLHGLSGVVMTEGLDVQTTWYQLFWARLGRIVTILASGFSSLSTSIADLEGTLMDHMDLVDSWFVTLSESLSSQFSSLENAVSFNTERVEAWFDWFAGFFRDFFNGFNSKLDTLISKIQELIDGQSVDEGVTDDMQQSEDELGNMTDQMEQLSPTINAGDVNVDVDDLVSQEGVSSVTSVFSIFTGNAFISVMLTIVIGMATAGYVFFGKR